jgi:hypothetical protein
MAAPWHPRYELVVGLEVHVQLKTRSKIFCPCSTEFGAPPNANTCPVCLALPGALPVLNAHAVQLAVRAALALDCTVHRASVFARKNYFYPDLPKGYQISQFDQPLATGGRLVIGTADDGAPRVVGITRAHMEEDAGKSVHDRFPAATAIDLNRAGSPLVEIVSEPDIRTPAEAREYCVRLKEVLEYTEVSDANMEEGSLRVDANVSIRSHGSATLGTKTEIKNMNSFAGVERAIAVEFERQCALLEAGERVVQQTLLWDADRHEVRPARSKEGSHDYRYFPDPDLPPLLLAEHWIEAQRRALPELPAVRELRAWDRRYDAASKGAVLFERLYAALCEELFGAGLFGREAWRALRDTTLVHAFFFRLFDDLLAREEGEEWFGAEGKAAFVARVARRALEGVDPFAMGPWGASRRVFLRHLLFGGKLPPALGFDRGPFEVVGGRATVVQGQLLSLAGRESAFCPSWRFVTDLATDASETALAGGPSDRRFSRWYATDLARWLAFERKTLKP